MNIVEFMSVLARELPDSLITTKNEIEEKILVAIKNNDSKEIKNFVKDTTHFTNERTVTAY